MLVSISPKRHSMCIFARRTSPPVREQRQRHQGVLGWPSGRDIAHIPFEPTGPYHHWIARQRRLLWAKVNPLQARRFAHAAGAQAKTDAIDASMLVRMSALPTPPVKPISSDAINDTGELHIARLALIKDRTTARNCEHACRSPLLMRNALAQVDRQITAIDAFLTARLQNDPERVSRVEILIRFMTLMHSPLSPCSKRCLN